MKQSAAGSVRGGKVITPMGSTVDKPVDIPVENFGDNYVRMCWLSSSVARLVTDRLAVRVDRCWAEYEDL